MKSKVLIIVLLALVLLLGGLFVGTQYGASSNWTNELASKASTELGKIGFNKKEELAKTELTSVMGEAIDPKLKQEEAALEQMLQEYFDMKVAGLTDSQKFKDLESRIETIKLQVFERYNSEIDNVFID